MQIVAAASPCAGLLAQTLSMVELEGLVGNQRDQKTEQDNLFSEAIHSDRSISVSVSVSVRVDSDG